MDATKELHSLRKIVKVTLLCVLLGVATLHVLGVRERLEAVHAYDAYCASHREAKIFTTLANGLFDLDYEWILPTAGTNLKTATYETYRLAYSAYYPDTNMVLLFLRGEQMSLIYVYEELPQRHPYPYGDIILKDDETQKFVGTLHVFNVTQESIWYGFTRAEDPTPHTEPLDVVPVSH